MAMSLLDQPSAVGHMLSLLASQPPAGQPGQPPPMPAAPMPLPDVAMQPQPPRQNLLGTIHDYVQDRLTGGVPAEYQQGGLLSPEEIRAAKPGIMQVLGHGDAYRKNLDRIMEMHQLAAGLQEHKRVMDARANMPQDLSLPDQLKYAATHGDMEMIKALGGPLEGMLSAKTPAPAPPHTVTTREGVMQWNPVTGKFEPTGFHAPDRPDIPQIISAAGPVNADGSPGAPAYFRVPKENGPATPISGITPRAGSSAQNAQNMAAEALLRSSVSEMTNADTFMKSYEKELANGTKSINGLAQFMGGIGNSFTHDDPASRAIQNTALTTLNTINPDLARYIRRGLSFAEGEAGISKRPSDFRTKMAAFLSTAASGASPEMIGDIQGRRNSILTPLHEVLNNKPSGAAGSKPKLTQAQYDAGRAKGHSQAEIATHYDLTGITAK